MGCWSSNARGCTSSPREHLARQQAEGDAHLAQRERERQARPQLAPLLQAVDAFRVKLAAGLDAPETDFATRRQIVRLLLEDVVVTGDDGAIHDVVPLTGFSSLRPADRGANPRLEAR